MEKKYMIAMDQGTTSSRCILFDRNGRVVSEAHREFEQIYPQAGWVEHRPMEIWASQLAVTIEALSKVNAHIQEVAALGITNQRETTIVWDRETGEPVYNAIVWQCRRTSERIEALRQSEMDGYVREATGLIPDAYFSASKIEWILDHVEGARARAEAGELLFGTVDSWLIWKLTEGRVHVTDYTNASRTMLFDIHRLTWDEKLLDYFHIPRCMMPEVRPSSCVYGTTAEELLGGSVPIAGTAGDQQAALFGQCCFSAGEMKNTYGTGCFLLMHTGDVPVRSAHGLLTTMAASCSETPQYALEGSVFVAGAVLQWLRDAMRMLRSAPQSEAYCRAVPNTNGVYIVPAFAGLGAPHWEQDARGMIVGLTRGAGKEHLIRAAVESMAYQTSDLIQAMEQDAGLALEALRVDGGASANDFLMQFQADILNGEIIRPNSVETTAKGAAFLAGLAVGFWRDQESLRALETSETHFYPQMEPQKREQLLKDWHRAVDAALYWARY